MRAVLRLTIMMLVAALVMVSAFWAGFLVNYAVVNVSRVQTSIPQNFGIFWEAWKIIQDEYYGTIPSPQVLTHGGIRGMLQGLGDPHTVLEEPEAASNEQSNLKGETGDVGLNLDLRKGIIIVVSAIPGSPADKTGLRNGDILLKINNKDLPFNITAQDASAMLRGPIGSKVSVTIHRAGETDPIDIEMTREKSALPTVDSKVLPGTTLGYIRVAMETSETSKEFTKALDSLKSQNMTGLVLDLRNNPGGLFPDPVLDISGQFLKNNDIVLFEKYRDGSEKEYRAGSGRSALDMPLVVLVNNGTASAAEILAGALQDYRRAVLIGEPTYGKGSVQSVRQLSDGAALHITIATWYTPKHSQIEGTGLRPDISVPLTEEDIRSSIDPQLDRAIDYLKKGA